MFCLEVIKRMNNEATLRRDFIGRGMSARAFDSGIVQLCDADVAGLAQLVSKEEEEN